jgi:hypothetical protein
LNAYVDTSCLIAIVLDQRGSAATLRELSSFDFLHSSNLLEAELRSVLRRERVDQDPTAFLTRLTWIHPDRPLTPEFDRVLKAGYVRGADLWHLACALYLAEDPSDLTFLTLDVRQREVSRNLGFA